MNYLYINSNDRIDGTIDNAIYSITVPISDKSRVELLSFSCPNTIYNITALNNRLTFNNGSSDFSINIPIGAYSKTNLLSTIQTLLNASGSGLTFSVSQSPSSFRVTISAGANFSLLFSTGVNQINSVLGFPNINTGSSTSHTGTSVMNLGFPSHLLINIPEFGILYNSSATNNYSTFVIPIEANSTDFIFWQSDKYEQSANVKGQYIGNMTVRIRDSNGQPLELHGAGYQMLLRFS